jgi:hypothetical protein
MSMARQASSWSPQTSFTTPPSLWPYSEIDVPNRSLSTRATFTVIGPVTPLAQSGTRQRGPKSRLSPVSTSPNSWAHSLVAPVPETPWNAQIGSSEPVQSQPDSSSALNDTASTL